MPEHPHHPRFKPVYEESFCADRAKLGLSGSNFDYFWRDLALNVGDYPWEYSVEIPDSDGIRIYRTRRAFPDIPAMFVYYRVNQPQNQVVFLGLGPDWSASDTFSLEDLLGEP